MPDHVVVHGAPSLFTHYLKSLRACFPNCTILELHTVYWCLQLICCFLLLTYVWKPSENGICLKNPKVMERTGKNPWHIPQHPRSPHAWVLCNHIGTTMHNNIKQNTLHYLHALLIMSYQLDQTPASHQKYKEILVCVLLGKKPKHCSKHTFLCSCWHWNCDDHLWSTSKIWKTLN
jgi:hypothetical protein